MQPLIKANQIEVNQIKSDHPKQVLVGDRAINRLIV